jgi:uncharacterized protein (DUF2062 family)
MFKPSRLDRFLRCLFPTAVACGILVIFMLAFYPHMVLQDALIRASIILFLVGALLVSTGVYFKHYL